jgi:hypothetical protein
MKLKSLTVWGTGCKVWTDGAAGVTVRPKSYQQPDLQPKKYKYSGFPPVNLGAYLTLHWAEKLAQQIVKWAPVITCKWCKTMTWITLASILSCSRVWITPSWAGRPLGRIRRLLLGSSGAAASGGTRGIVRWINWRLRRCRVCGRSSRSHCARGNGSPSWWRLLSLLYLPERRKIKDTTEWYSKYSLKDMRWKFI